MVSAPWINKSGGLIFLLIKSKVELRDKAFSSYLLMASVSWLDIAIAFMIFPAFPSLSYTSCATQALPLA